MAPQLTDLPGEIRNTIFEYVLSDAHGLLLWVDPAGTPRLCRRFSRERSLMAYRFSSRADASRVEFNQLQYVSRQIWAEVHGLERRYNIIRASCYATDADSLDRQHPCIQSILGPNCAFIKMATTLNEGHRSFPLMKLPAELRIEIYRHSLFCGAHSVPRGRLSTLHSLRYRYAKQPTLLRERIGTDCSIPCKDYECRQRLAQHEHAIEPIQANEFAFGLFRTSKEVSHEAFGVFFGQAHFVFESRLDLHMFLRANKHAYLIKSLTFNTRKSHGPHSKQLKARFTTWKLRSECFWGPTVLHSLRELGRHCPKLAYMEMIDECQCDSVQDGIDLGTKGYVEWKEVQYIRAMGLEDFSYLLPDHERYRDVVAKGLFQRHLSTSFFDWPLQQQNRLREMVEAYIRSSMPQPSLGEQKWRSD